MKVGVVAAAAAAWLYVLFRMFWVVSSSFSWAFSRLSVRVAWAWAVSLTAFTCWSSLSWRSVALGADPYLPSRHIESFLRVFKQFTCNIPRG